MESEIIRYKAVICGHNGVGKTAFLKRFIQADIDKKYNATAGAEIRPIIFNTTKGNICFDVWDIITVSYSSMPRERFLY